MAREILKAPTNSYIEIDAVLQTIDPTWNNIKTWDKFKFTKHPYNTYYINPLSDTIEEIRGPYKVFDTLGNTLQIERNNTIFKANKDLIKYGPLVVYLKTTNNLYMLFISRNAITDEFVEQSIIVNRRVNSSISINNTTSSPIYYSYESLPVPPISFIEVLPNAIEVLGPTSAAYLYIKNSDNNPFIINTTNTRTKLVNDYFLLVCPSNVSKVQAAKLTGNPLSTIIDELDLFITI